MGQQWQHPMSVLNDRACQDNAQGYAALCVERDKNQVRTGFRNESDQTGYHENNPFALLDCFLNVQVFGNGVHDQQCTKGPQEDSGDVLACDVFPEMFVQEVVWHSADNKEGDTANQENSHPDPIPGLGPDPAKGQRKNEDSKQGG